jgi:signal peptidase I
VLSVSLAVAAAFLIRAFVFEIIRVDGTSMFPTLYTNERVAIEKVKRYGGMPKRGDIIIVEYPGMDGTYVKRAIGLPGETIEIRDNTVYINGTPLVETYINPMPYGDMDAVLVPDGHVFVMGDNRARSLDSRATAIGPISHDAIIGHGLFVIWPFSEIRGITYA